MKYIEIQQILEKLEIFSTNDLRKIDSNFEKKKIYLWKKNWLIKSIYRWYYILEKQKIDKLFLYKIANKIYYPSYISLESALNYYKIIPEAVYTITSITTKKTNNVENELSNFSYRSIKKELFFWYKVEIINNNKFFIAELEKTLLDFFYLNKNINDEADFEWLRLNFELLRKNLDRNKIEKYLKVFNKNNLNKKIEILFNLIDKW